MNRQVGVAGAAGSSKRGVLRDISRHEGNTVHLVGLRVMGYPNLTRSAIYCLNRCFNLLVSHPCQVGAANAASGRLYAASCEIYGEIPFNGTISYIHCRRIIRTVVRWGNPRMRYKSTYNSSNHTCHCVSNHMNRTVLTACPNLSRVHPNSD